MTKDKIVLLLEQRHRVVTSTTPYIAQCGLEIRCEECHFNTFDERCSLIHDREISVKDYEEVLDEYPELFI